MYRPDKYRIYSFILLIIFILAILVLAGYLWSTYLKTDKLFSMGWLAFLILWITASVTGIFIIVNTLTDTSILNKHIENIVSEERTKMLSELDEKRKKETEEIIAEGNIEELIDDIIPDSKELKTIENYASKLISNLASRFDFVQGLCYHLVKNNFNVLTKFAFTDEQNPESFKPGETLPGQAAKNQEVMVVGELPENYFEVKSGLGGSLPKYLVFLPLVYKNKTIALLELASFKSIDEITLHILNELSLKLGERFAKFSK